MERTKSTSYPVPKSLRKTFLGLAKKMTRTRSLPSFFSSPMFKPSGEIARPASSKAMLALLKELPQKPDQDILLANPKYLPAGFTNKFEKMSPAEYEQRMNETWIKTRKENEQLRRQAQELMISGYLEHRAAVKQVRTYISSYYDLLS